MVIKTIAVGILVILAFCFIPYALGLFLNDDEYSGPATRWQLGFVFLIVIAGILFAAWVVGSLILTLIPSKGVI